MSNRTTNREGTTPTGYPLLLGLLAASALAVAPAFADSITLEPTRDNTLYEDVGGALSNGAGEFLFAGRTATSSLRRAVLAFDVAAALPAGAIVTDVELTLEMSMTAGDDSRLFELYRLLSDWGEGTSVSDMMGGGQGADATTGDATWVHTFFDTDFWQTPGGDFQAAASAAKTVGTVGSYTFNSTPELVADVQGWVDDPASEFGWVLLGEEGEDLTAKRFDSRERTDPSATPKLTVEYQLLIFADGFESGDVTGWD